MKGRHLLLAVIVVLAAIFGFRYFNDGTLKTTGTLSNMSKSQLYNDVVLANHVVGSYVVKSKFKETESPLVWFGTDDPEFLSLALRFVKNGAGKGIGSDSFKGGFRDSPLIVNAVLAGEVVCDDVNNSSLVTILRGVELHAQTVCFGTLPPFAKDFSYLIAVLLDLPMNELDLEVLRKQLVKVQLDVYNREFLGIETWGEISKSESVK